MLLPLEKSNVTFTQGFIEVVRLAQSPNIKYEDKEIKNIKINNQSSNLVIKASERDINFTLNISELKNLKITVNSGAILAKAVPYKIRKNLTKIGAIELRIKKEEVGGGLYESWNWCYSY
jgi:hypothetical protein